MKVLNLILLLCLASCEFTKVKNLTYYGHKQDRYQIELNGYYLTTLETGQLSPLFFYSDGTAGEFYPLVFEDEFSIKEHISGQSTDKWFYVNWGAFKTFKDSIKIQIVTKVDVSYGPPNFNDVVEYHGKILNDSTFNLSLKISPRPLNSNKKKFTDLNYTYRLRQGETKPDSTMNWQRTEKRLTR
ncbi:MAG: hypothetical protein K8H85_06990 [Cyclobacteriaceae bacterium]|nr:hypothetical protein [Cyclobacteriaceae bacterium]